jgi:uncharacterized membrane protein YbhN (UPF0104 family)
MQNENEPSPSNAKRDHGVKGRRRISPWRLLLLALIVSGFVFYFVKHPERLPDWGALRWEYFSTVIVLSVLANLAAAFGYHAILKKCHASLGYVQTVRIFIVGRTLNLISPQGGTLYAAVALKSGSGLSYTQYTATMAANLWLDLTLASITAAIALLISQPSELHVLFWIFIAAFFLSIIGIRVALVLTLRGQWEKLPFTLIPRRIRMRFIEASVIFADLMGNSRLCLTFGAWALVNTTLHGIRLWLCFAMVEAWIPWSEAFATTILVKASNTISITPGNFGIVEGIIGLMGSSFGLSAGAAVVAGLAYRFASYIALFGTSLCFIIFKTDSIKTP